LIPTAVQYRVLRYYTAVRRKTRPIPNYPVSLRPHKFPNEEAHDSPYSGHFGKHKVLHQINQNFWWPGWTKDVESYVFGCLVCQRNKAQTDKKAGLLQPLSVPSFKWESASMDFITQLPVTKTGYDAIAVSVDMLTKVVHFARHTRTARQET
jgi:hypothetical protein